MLSITKLVQTTKAFVNFRLAASLHTSLEVSDSSRVPTKTFEEKLGLPLRPKKPLTPYFRFLNSQRPTLIKDNPKLKATEIVQLCAKKWSDADEPTKIKLNEEYQKEKIVYIKKRAEYESVLTDEQKASLKVVRKDLMENRAKRVQRKKVKELGRPKKPATGFIRFLGEKFQGFETGKGSANYREFQTKITNEWNSLSEEKKKAYNDKSAQESAQYKIDLKNWEMNMIRLGHTDLVRGKTLLDNADAPKAKKSKKSKADSSDSD